MKVYLNYFRLKKNICRNRDITKKATEKQRGTANRKETKDAKDRWRERETKTGGTETRK